MRFKKVVTKCLVASGSTTSIAVPRGITKDSFKLTLDKFKNQVFKDFAARHQVNYLRQNLRKPVGVTARACAWRLQEISNYLEYFPEPDSNVIEYTEKLEVLEVTNKQSGTKKHDKEKSEDKTGKSKNKTKKFPKKYSKYKEIGRASCRERV